LPKYKVKGSKIKLVPIVSSVRAARLIAKKWLQSYNYVPDAFVVEGPEAGGHLGFSYEDLDNKRFTLEELVADIVPFAEELSIVRGKTVPVIAGGGITNGRICSEPPSLDNKEEIIAEDIQVSIPKGEKQKKETIQKGKITTQLKDLALLIAYK
jgi:hypothetical protein